MRVLAASDSLEIHLTFYVCVHTCEQRVGETYLIMIPRDLVRLLSGTAWPHWDTMLVDKYAILESRFTTPFVASHHLVDDSDMIPG
jgi:hypothetical protein